MIYSESITIYRCECDECGVKVPNEKGFDFETICDAEIAALERGFTKQRGTWFYCPRCSVGRDNAD